MVSSWFMYWFRYAGVVYACWKSTPYNTTSNGDTFIVVIYTLTQTHMLTYIHYKHPSYCQKITRISIFIHIHIHIQRKAYYTIYVHRYLDVLHIQCLQSLENNMCWSTMANENDNDDDDDIKTWYKCSIWCLSKEKILCL